MPPVDISIEWYANPRTTLATLNLLPWRIHWKKRPEYIDEMLYAVQWEGREYFFPGNCFEGNYIQGVIIEYFMQQNVWWIS